MSELGNLVLGTKQGITTLDPASGESIWTRPDAGATQGKRGLAEAILQFSGVAALRSGEAQDPSEMRARGVLLPQVIRTAEYLELWIQSRGTLVGLVWEEPDLVVVDPATGGERWRIKGADWLVQPTLIDCSHVGLVLIAGVAAGEGPRLSAVDLQTGALRWTRDDLLRGGSEDRESMAEKGMLRGPAMLRDTDSTIVLWTCSGSASRIDLGTGRSVWIRDDFAATYPAALRNTAGAIAASDLVVITEGRGAVALDAMTGAERWRRARLFPSVDDIIGSLYKGVPRPLLDQVRLRATTSAVIAIGPLQTYLLAFDPATGAPLWREPYYALRETLGFTIVGDFIYAADADSVYMLEARSGTERSITALKLKKDERPLFIAILSDGIYLQSRRHVAFVNIPGALQYCRALRECPTIPSLDEVARALEDFANVLQMMSEGLSWYGGKVGGNPNSNGTSGFWDAASDLVDSGRAPRLGEEPRDQELLGFARVEAKDDRGRIRQCLLRFDPHDGRNLGVIRLKHCESPVRIDRWHQRIFVLGSDDQIDAFGY